MLKKIYKIIADEKTMYTELLHSSPTLVMIFFVISVICMNLLANKELINYQFIALDCGFLVSWISFLCMDILTKTIGPKLAIRASILSIIVNLLIVLIFNIVAIIPSNWSEYYTHGLTANIVLNNIFGGSWYILFGSTVAFAAASIINIELNHLIGYKLKKYKYSYKIFALRCFISTAIGQFIDNLLFAIIVSYVLFGWTPIQIIVCSLTGAFFELVCEIVFSPIGYKFSKSWERYYESCNNWKQ